MRLTVRRIGLIFFKRITTWINQNAMNLDNVILCGDFNCQLDTNNNDKSVNILNNVLKNYYFKNC